jgi:hypothetical protein
VNSKADWLVEYQNELEHANSARAEGNEGMARVCARRAAGIIIGEYLQRHGHTIFTHSAYDRILQFTNLPDVSQYYKDIANHSLLKVDKNHHFPAEVDLIADARLLYDCLLADPKE